MAKQPTTLDLDALSDLELNGLQERVNAEVEKRRHAQLLRDNLPDFIRRIREEVIEWPKTQAFLRGYKTEPIRYQSIRVFHLRYWLEIDAGEVLARQDYRDAIAQLEQELGITIEISNAIEIDCSGNPCSKNEPYIRANIDFYPTTVKSAT